MGDLNLASAVLGSDMFHDLLPQTAITLILLDEIIILIYEK